MALLYFRFFLRDYNSVVGGALVIDGAGYIIVWPGLSFKNMFAILSLWVSLAGFQPLIMGWFVKLPQCYNVQSKSQFHFSSYLNKILYKKGHWF